MHVIFSTCLVNLHQLHIPFSAHNLSLAELWTPELFFQGRELLKTLAMTLMLLQMTHEHDGQPSPCEDAHPPATDL